MINNKERMLQGSDFEGLRVGRALATDMDCFMHYNSGQFNLFIIVEFKLSTAYKPSGQFFAFKTLVKTLNSDENTAAILLYCEHSTPVEELIDAGNTLVYSTYGSSDELVGLTLREAQILLLKKYLGNRLDLQTQLS